MICCLIISAPSGAGKTTVVKEILKRRLDFSLSISHTTRKIRNNEVNNIDYSFISKDEFQKKIQNNDFLEHAQIFDNFYGTCKKNILNSEKQNFIFDIDWQGAQQIIHSQTFDILSIFLLPPSLSELKKRLQNRGTDSKDIIDKRLKGAKAEISHHNIYDFVLINDDLEILINKIMMIIEIWLFKINNKKLSQQKINFLLKEEV